MFVPSPDFETPACRAQGLSLGNIMFRTPLSIRGRFLIRLLVSLLLVSTPLAVSTTASAADTKAPPGLLKRAVPDKPAHAVIKRGYSHKSLHLKFVEGSDFRLRGSRLVSEDPEAQQALDDVLRRVPRHARRPAVLASRDGAGA